MDSLLGNRFLAYHSLVCLLGFQSTFFSSFNILTGVYSTLLAYNCSSEAASTDTAAAQGQLSSINVQYRLCDSSLGELTSVLFFAGMGLGSLIVGPMSDSIGRVPTVVIGAAAATGCSLLGNYCSQFWLHLLSRCMSGASTAMMQCAVHVYGNEVHTLQHRPKFNFMWGSGMSIGSALTAALAYCTRNHQHYTLCSSSIGLLIVLTAACLPESPIWLLERRRLDRATSALRRMARIDRRARPAKEYVSMVAADISGSQHKEKQSLRQSLKQLEPKSKLYLAALVPYALTVTVNTYGFAFVISKVVSNIYIYMALKAMALLPSAAVMNLAPRHVTLFICGLFGGLLCLCVAALSLLEPEMSGWAGWAAIGLGLPGTFFGGTGFAVLLTAAAELFPTSVRNTCMGWLYLMTRAGAAVPPALAFLPSMPLRILLLAMPMLVSCWPPLLLPDTRRLHLHAEQQPERKDHIDGLLKMQPTAKLPDSQNLASSLASSMAQL